MEKAMPLLTKSEKSDSPLASARRLAAALLAKPEQVNPQALVEVVSQGVQGEDLVVLTALACHRAGGDAWSAFRASSQDLLGSQPLSGSVVVLVNRLSAMNSLQLAKQ
jgi:hypothetical protein